MPGPEFFPSNSLLVEVSSASCDLNSRTFIIWTALSQESRDVVSEGMLWSPACELQREGMFTQDDSQGAQPATGSDCCSGSSHFATLGPCLLVVRDGSRGFSKVFQLGFNCLCTALLDTHFLPDPFLVLIRQSAVTKKTLSVIPQLPRQNAILSSGFSTKHHIWWQRVRGAFLLRSHAPLKWKQLECLHLRVC